MYRVDTSYNEKEVERVGDSGSEQSRVKSYENERDRVWKVEWKWNRDIKLTITLKKFRLFIPYSPISIRVYVKGTSHHSLFYHLLSSKRKPNFIDEEYAFSELFCFKIIQFSLIHKSWFSIIITAVLLLPTTNSQF